MVLLLLAAFQSYLVRRIMASRIYRSRALWTGGVALVVIPMFLVILFGDLNTSSLSLLSSIVLAVVGSILMFAWIDSTIGVAREFDFFHTDVMGWKRFRIVAWPMLIAGSIVAGGVPSQYLLGVALLAASFAYGCLVLVRTAPRVHDETMTQYLKWLGLIVAALVAEFATRSVNPRLNFPLVIGSFFFYRAAKSLSVRRPLERVSQVAGASS